MKMETPERYGTRLADARRKLAEARRMAEHWTAEEKRRALLLEAARMADISEQIRREG